MKVENISSAMRANESAVRHAARIRHAAMQLEASFLTEMLKSAGLGKSVSSFGGGAGEDQFGTFLVRAQADEIARAGGIGLAETFFQALMEAENDSSEFTADHSQTWPVAGSRTRSAD